ncbi:hypothetical protein ACRAWD_10210 [Caulobacter segnis]
MLLTLLCVATYLVTRAIMNSPIGRSELVGGALYGWFLADREDARRLCPRPHSVRK